ncbi:hypothetical protein ACFOLJ_27665 [Rugamonas sp. CCM 8940]|uniref:hypothetical protein n=1 Tax=Rugamonas sp. CCM 8940 TaxID=2765359 RepID=UPI0018F3B3D6|nr:hypothetical protein [Rugamonas sp. CCM 8940]MBJ7311250.1 hypothetical protein [Rugamonas sp. CCM 8940]
MNRPLLAATLLAIVTTLAHTVVGTPEIEAPLLRSGLKFELILLLLACWHLVTAALAISSIALGLALRPTVARVRARARVRLVSYLWLSFGSVFILVALMYAGPSMLLQLPQWLLLLPVGALGLWGARVDGWKQVGGGAAIA